jgi:prephenate dehydrogenase
MEPAQKMKDQIITIIGSNGGMGSLLKQRFQSKGHNVYCCDKPLEEGLLSEAIPNSEIILLAIPLEAFGEVLKRLQPYLQYSSILMDICSVKMQPLKLMLNTHSGPVVGTHPLFGPTPDAATPLRVALTYGRDKNSLQTVHQLLEHSGLLPFQTTAEKHDRALAFIQGLNFVTTLAYLAAFSNEQEISEFLTPSFYRRLQAAQKMLTEDAQMFQTLFEANPFSQDAVRQFRSFLNLTSAGELDLLVDKANWWWRRDPGGGGV